MKIPIRALELTQILGQPCEYYVPGERAVVEVPAVVEGLEGRRAEGLLRGFGGSRRAWQRERRG